MKRMSILLLVLGSVVIMGCDPFGLEEWTGVFYPKGKALKEVRGGPFESKEACIAWGESQKQHSSDRFDCGKNCSEDSYGDLSCRELVSSKDL